MTLFLFSLRDSSRTVICAKRLIMLSSLLCPNWTNKAALFLRNATGTFTKAMNAALAVNHSLVETKILVFAIVPTTVNFVSNIYKYFKIGYLKICQISNIFKYLKFQIFWNVLEYFQIFEIWNIWKYLKFEIFWDVLKYFQIFEIWNIWRHLKFEIFPNSRFWNIYK